MPTISTENQTIENWQQQEIPETVLEPELEIIDPHHHLWDLRQIERPSSFQQKVYLCQDYSHDITESGHNIVQTVFAQCGAFYRADGPEEMRCVGETEFVHGMAAMSRSGLYGPMRLCTGIFGTANLQLGSGVERVLEGHMAASNYFRGIRSPFPGQLNQEYLDGFSILDKYNLSFDNYSPDFDRLPTLAELARKFPNVTIIVNHLGGKIDPNADQETILRWQNAVNTVAECPNVVMKAGGAQQRVGPWEPPFHMNQRSVPISSEELSELLYPYYRYVIDKFSPDRCMFESNFPVDKECVSYRTLWNTFKRIASKAGLSESEKKSIFSGTAIRAYRLNTTTE